MNNKSLWSSAATAFLVGVETFVVAFTAAWVGLTLVFHVQSWKTPSAAIALALSVWSAVSIFNLAENSARTEMELQRMAMQQSTAAGASDKRKIAGKTTGQKV